MNDLMQKTNLSRLSPFIAKHLPCGRGGKASRLPCGEPRRRGCDYHRGGRSGGCVGKVSRFNGQGARAHGYVVIVDANGDVVLDASKQCHAWCPGGIRRAIGAIVIARQDAPTRSARVHDGNFGVEGGSAASRKDERAIGHWRERPAGMEGKKKRKWYSHFNDMIYRSSYLSPVIRLVDTLRVHREDATAPNHAQSNTRVGHGEGIVALHHGSGHGAGTGGCNSGASGGSLGGLGRWPGRRRCGCRCGDGDTARELERSNARGPRTPTSAGRVFVRKPHGTFIGRIGC